MIANASEALCSYHGKMLYLEDRDLAEKQTPSEICLYLRLALAVCQDYHLSIVILTGSASLSAEKTTVRFWCAGKSLLLWQKTNLPHKELMRYGVSKPYNYENR